MGPRRAFGDPRPQKLEERPWAHDGLGCLGLVMDSIPRENWLKIAASMGRSDSVGRWSYARAKAIAEGRPDPLAELNKLPT